MRRIVLVSCVSKKLPRPALASELYISPLFRLAFAYAKSLKPDAIFILSAKYGLVPTTRKIAPYDETLIGKSNADIRAWADKVFLALSCVCDPMKDEIIFLAGERYRRHLAPRFKNVTIPARGLGIGKQLQFFKKASRP